MVSNIKALLVSPEGVLMPPAPRKTLSDSGMLEQRCNNGGGTGTGNIGGGGGGSVEGGSSAAKSCLVAGRPRHTSRLMLLMVSDCQEQAINAKENHHRPMPRGHVV